MDDFDELGVCPVCGAPGSSCRDAMKGPGGLRIVRFGETEAVPMVRVEYRLWSAVDGTIVPDGDPRAAFLYAAAGDEIADSVAAELGIGQAPKTKATVKAGRKQRESVEEAAEDAEKE
jgi:hypothetical protein